MNRLSTTERATVVRALVEGGSIRATVRMTGVARNTVTKLLMDLGPACADYLSHTQINLATRRVECDEIWTFVGMKEKSVPAGRCAEFGVGDVWTWVALDADSKLCVSWMVGERDTDTAVEFITNVASRLANRVQMTTDDHPPYLIAVETALENQIDHSLLVKRYGTLGLVEQRRHSPAVCTGSDKTAISGNPVPALVSTSYVERRDLTMGMRVRRVARLTNGFSRKVENHMAAVSLHFAYYNLCRFHQSLKRTPAMAAGIADHPWSVEELVGLLEAQETT